jgi:aminoglycoside 2'-N-acetyltransferase I
VDPHGIDVRLVAEPDLTPEDDAAIRELLAAACPGRRWASRPDLRLLLIRDARLVGHLAIERRVIEVGSADVAIAGIGDVAVLPDLQRQGLGRQLIDELLRVLLTDLPVSFGYLTAGPADAGFYRAVGLTRVDVTVRYKDPERGTWDVADPLNFVLPAGSPIAAWPPGPIDLRGTPW